MSRRILCPDELNPTEDFRKWSRYVETKHRDGMRKGNDEKVESYRSLVRAYSKTAYIVHLETRAAHHDLNVAQQRIHRQREANRELTKKLNAIEGEQVAFHIHVYPAHDTGGFWVDCPERPGVVSEGESVPETLRMMAEAWELSEDE